MGGNGTLLGDQMVGLLFVLGWATCLMGSLFCLLNYLGLFRASASDEVEGLDSRYHASTRKLNTQVGPTVSYGKRNQQLRQMLNTMDDFRDNNKTVAQDPGPFSAGNDRSWEH